MSNPLTHVATRSVGVIVGAPARATELGMERVLQGRYKIEEPLGVGGSSQVYLARDQALNRDVALKVLDPEAASDGNLRRMFVKEARALAQLSHPNIVAVYDVGEVDDSPFIVMEYLPGGSMKERIEQAGPLKTGDAVRIAIEVANGLAFAHSKGIIHADLKPANILFDANDAAKICDFGIARNPQEDADTPQLYATAMYVAPERVEGKSATVQSDVYGLGLVLYEGLVGKPPFTSTNAAVLLRDHVVRQPVPPSHLRPSLPKELDSIVLKALAKQPNLRYPKASDLAVALQRIENIDKELATTRIVMADPLQDFVPRTEQSPVVALFSAYGQPIRKSFFAFLAAFPVFALATLAGFEVVGALLAAGLVAVVGIAGQLGIALGIAWVMMTAFIFVFVPGLALLFALVGVYVWLRDISPEQVSLAMAMPVLTPLGLAPALVLTTAAVFGLLGVLTVATGALLTMVFAIALGVQSLGPYAQTGLLFPRDTPPAHVLRHAAAPSEALVRALCLRGRRRRGRRCDPALHARRDVVPHRARGRASRRGRPSARGVRRRDPRARRGRRDQRDGAAGPGGDAIDLARRPEDAGPLTARLLRGRLPDGGLLHRFRAFRWERLRVVVRFADPLAELRRALRDRVRDDDVAGHRAPRHRLERFGGLRRSERGILADPHDDLVLERSREVVSVPEHGRVPEHRARLHAGVVRLRFLERGDELGWRSLPGHGRDVSRFSGANPRLGP